MVIVSFIIFVKLECTIFWLIVKKFRVFQIRTVAFGIHEKFVFFVKRVH